MKQQRFSLQTRYVLLTAALAAAAGGGMWYASRVRLEQQNSATDIAGQRVIASIMVGALKSATEAADPNPRLEQKSTYTTDDRLVMRVTSEPSVRDPFEVGVRLLAESGRVIEMDPPSVTFAPGTSSFCCWQVTKEGTYTLQIFRPEKIISTIPLKVTKSITTGGGTHFKLF